jgi:dTDP-4-dehydrorhamnose reductase
LARAGQVGQALAAEPHGWELTACARAELDITDPRATHKAMRDLKPDLIINAAAMTNVDACEKDRERAEAVNFRAPANLAAQCSVHDIPLIHLSTDYVFDGRDGGVPYTTEAQMNPLSVYADTKMMGEMAVRQELAWHIVLRVSSVFSAFGTNLLTKTVALLAKNDEVKIVSDQTSCPTYAPDLAKALIVLTDGILRGKHDGFGTFHYCGKPATTRLEFVQAIMEAYAPYTQKRPRILPALSSDFPGFAERPAYSVLDCAKIRAAYSIEQKPWREGLAEAVTSLHQQGKATFMTTRKGIILSGGSGTRLYPRHQGRQQTIDADPRQADDLLPAHHHDAGRHQRYPHHQHTTRSAAVSRPAWRRRTMGH